MAKRARRYTEKERTRILAAAEREGLSGPKAAKKFGISMLTFYTWRKKAKAARVDRAERSTKDPLGGVVRAQVQAKVRDLLRGIVEEEVGSYLDVAFGSARRRRLKA